MTSNHPPIIAASVAAARRRRALPSPQDISTTSLLTILGVVAAHEPGASSRDPVFDRKVRNRDFAAGGRRALRRHPAAPANASARPRGFLWVMAVRSGRRASPSEEETTEMAV